MSGPIERAETQIAMILKLLEKEIDATVQSIEVRDIEVTGCGDTRRQILRSVIIETRPAPGTRWGSLE